MPLFLLEEAQKDFQKNIAIFMKSPLISYPIKEALKSKIFSDVIVSSDDDKTIKIAKKYGALTVLRSKNSSDLPMSLKHVENTFQS